MNICAEGLADEVLLVKSALTQARYGNAAPERLFKQCGKTWGLERVPQELENLQIFAVDSALSRTADTP